MGEAEHREALYRTFADPERDVGEKVERGLAIGTELLGLSTGFVTRIEGDLQEVVHATGDHPLLQPGETCPLDEAYCRRTIELDSPLAVQNAATSESVSAVARERFDLGTYVGAKVTVDEETYGTVCFADETARERAFTDGETYFVELFAKLLGQALERRAHERELAERQRHLEEQREIYRAVVESSFDLVFRIDADGRFTFVSPPAEDLLGVPAAAYEGEPFTAMLADDATAATARDLFERVMAGETVQHEYLPLRHADGGTVFVDVRVTPLYDGDVADAERGRGDVVAAQGTARDATGRFRRERMIRVLNRVLRHNLRNDMGVVRGFAELIRERSGGEEAGFAERIVATSNRLLELGETARKLDENLDGQPALAPTDVVPLVRRAGAQIDERYPAASVALEVPESAVALTATRLEIAVWELVDNAAKHGGDAPDVEVGVSGDEDPVIYVADDGPGLPALERAVLAAGDETPLSHGMGLGLWLARWIVESVDGTLRVPETDTGTRIEVVLPGAGADGG